MDKGLREIHVDSINTEQVKKLIEVKYTAEKLYQFDKKLCFHVM